MRVQVVQASPAALKVRVAEVPGRAVDVEPRLGRARLLGGHASDDALSDHVEQLGRERDVQTVAHHAPPVTA